MYLTLKILEIIHVSINIYHFLRKEDTNIIYIPIGKAVVKDARKCTTCRECIRNDEEYKGFSEKVNLGKRKDVFEFHVESVGMYSPEDIVF